MPFVSTARKHFVPQSWSAGPYQDYWLRLRSPVCRSQTSQTHVWHAGICCSGSCELWSTGERFRRLEHRSHHLRPVSMTLSNLDEHALSLERRYPSYAQTRVIILHQLASCLVNCKSHSNPGAREYWTCVSLNCRRNREQCFSCAWGLNSLLCKQKLAFDSNT